MLPPTSPAPRPDRGRVIAGAAIGAIVILLVAVVAAFAVDDSDRSILDSAASTTRPGLTVPGPSGQGSTTTPPATTTTAPGSSGDLDAAVQEAIAFIEKTRGKKFSTTPVVNVYDEKAFVARYNHLLDEDYEKHKVDYDNATVTLQALGILRRGTSLIDAHRAFGATGVLGFYDPESKELSVRAGAITPFARTVIVHELTHAFDDQLVNLDRPEYDDAKDEVSFGFSALAEGSARYVEDEYRNTLSAADQRSAQREEASYGANFPVGEFTYAFLQLQLAPYSYGEDLVKDLRETGGEAALEDALRDPPHTSEQVMDFRKFQAKEARQEVAVPAADGTVVQDGVVGQITWQSILEPVVGRSTARDAAAGWGGDWFVSWTDGTVPCTRVSISADTSRDLSEMKSALDAWTKSRRGASLSATADLLTLTSCAR